MNLPPSENRTIAADDTTGANACPIWLRITALMHEIPFEADHENRVFLKKALEVSMRSPKLRVKKYSITMWVSVANTFYEFPTITAFAHKIGIKNARKAPIIKRIANARKKAIVLHKDSFLSEGYTFYLKKPATAENALIYFGIEGGG